MEAQPRQVVLYVTEDNNCPFEQWLDALRDRQARARIKKRLDRVGLGNLGDFKPVGAARPPKATIVAIATSLGNLGDFKPVGAGVMELRIDYGSGYRIYFAQSGATIILLLCGGDKSSQDQDILKAKQYWIDFQKRQNANP